MGTEYDLSDFDGVCRLFPLPGVVLFPHVVLPLHVFEPRYRQMTEDALADDRLITIVQAHPTPTARGTPSSPAPLEEVACLGRVLRHERLSDGRFNLLLLGCRRVRLTCEVQDSAKLYRRAEGELIDDDGPEEATLDPRRDELSSLFRAVLASGAEVDPDIESLLDSGIPLGPLTDIVAHALGLPAEVKQSFLNEVRVDQRADGLIAILRELPSKSPVDAKGRAFPPPFSEN